MKKFRITVALSLIVMLCAFAFAGCEKVKSEDAEGVWFFVDGKLEIADGAAKFNGADKQYSLDSKKGTMTLEGEEFVFGDNNSSLYASGSKARGVMSKPSKRDSFEIGEGFSYFDSEGRMCTLGFLPGNKVSVSFVSQDSLSNADMGEGTYEYSDGVVTILVNFISGGPKVLFYYIDKNIDLYDRVAVRNVAEFAKQTYEKQISSSEDTDEKDNFKLVYKAGQGGKITGKTEQTVMKSGSGSAVKAVADDGYVFEKWSDGSTSVTRIDSNVQKDITVTATFKRISYVLNYYAAEHGTVSGQTKQSVRTGEDGQKVKAIPNEGYVFSEWSDGVKTAERTDLNVSADISVTAKFVKGGYINYKAALGGSIEGEQRQIAAIGSYAKAVTAVAKEGYMFAGWSDGYPLPVRRDIAEENETEYTALFVEAQKLLVQYIADEGGSIRGIASQQVYAGSDAYAVTAVADTGYYFLGWSDGVLTAERQDTAVMSNITVHAKFVKLPVCVVTVDYGDGSVFTTTLSKGDKINIPIKQRTGYIFGGFDSPQGVVNNGDIWQQESDCTLTAIWEKQTYRIVLNAGEGTVSETSFTYTVEDLPKGLPAASHATKVFNGWKSPDGIYVDVLTTDNIGDYYLVAQYAEADDRFLYSLNNTGDGYIITGYEGYSANIVVPATYNGKPVVELKKELFSGNKDITSFTAGVNLKKIGDKAFYRCQNLETVNLGGCDKLESIGESAFWYCEKLSYVNVQGCSSLATIGSSTFANCQLTSFAFNECKSLKTVGYAAFDACNFSSVEMTGLGKLETIGSDAFRSNPLKEVYIKDCRLLRSIRGSFDVKSGLKTVSVINCPELISITDNYTQLNAETLDLTGSCKNIFEENGMLPGVNVTNLYTDSASFVNKLAKNNSDLLVNVQKIAIFDITIPWEDYFVNNFENSGLTEVRNGNTYTVYIRKAV